MEIDAVSDPMTAWSASMPLSLRRVIEKRGFQDPKSLYEFLNPQLKDMTHPFLIDGMQKGAERLAQAFTNNERICIYGDFDLDGTSGVAILIEGLRLLGFESLQYYQPRRLSEGYGLHKHALEQFKKEDVRLVMTVDVGITAVEEAEYAKKLGLDLIITDHHQPSETLPDAYAVINPNKGTCSSGMNHLCGAGVGFYFLLALKMVMKNQGLLKADVELKSLLDLFIIGTLTDMVPLIGENRILTKHGLLELAQTKRPGLKALLEAVKLHEKKLEAADVAIRLAPKLNALSRLDGDLRPVDILLEKDPIRAHTLTQKMMESHQKRIELQTSAEQSALKKIEDTEASVIFVASDEFHQGVIGLVATQLARNFNRPAYVGAINESGHIVGSARSPDGSGISVLKGLEAAQDLLVRFGGHHEACGFELVTANESALRERLQTYFQQKPEPTESKPDLDVLPLSELDSEFSRWLKIFEPFGVGFPPLVFTSNPLVISRKWDLKGGHLKYEVHEENSTQRFQALWFSPKVKTFDIGDHVKLQFQPQWSDDNWGKRFQLVIHDMSLLQPSM